MNIITKFGIGEIVEHNTYQGNKLIGSQLYKIIGITVSEIGVSVYTTRCTVSGNIINFSESELIGDPDFDQETCSYPETKED